jgi:hypothetical protein
MVIYQEGGETRQYSRSEDDGGNVLWRRDPPGRREKPSGEGMTTSLVKAVESSLHERRRVSRGRTFGL